jgi:hypothetical protein
MSATEAPGAAMAFRHEVAGAGQFLTDTRVEALLLGEARRRVVTGVFGIPREDQSLLVTMILVGSAATVLRGMAVRPWPRPSRSDAAMGGAVLNATLRGMVGGSSQAMPLAGGLIAFAVVAHALRPVVAGSARQGRAAAHRFRAAYDARYAT